MTLNCGSAASKKRNLPPAMPIVLECERCTACCRWPGSVCLTEPEITALAAVKGLSETDFIQQFARLRPDRRGLALLERPDGACIFLDGNNCAVQAAKPQQCRDFPNVWLNSLWGKVPLAAIQKDYPMLTHCAAFKSFLKAEGKESAA
jgi:Fe-S-cluster containining protein